MSVAKISQSFIQQYIESQGSIKKVMVEYQDRGMSALIVGGMPNLKLNSSGEVIIHPIDQKMYTREEVMLIILNWDSDEKRELNKNISIKEWFNKNYPQ